MDVFKIIEKYYDTDSKSYHFLVHHGMLVAKKALKIAERVKDLNPDTEFIKEAAILHDIGIFLTYAPKIGCFGYHPYICHGYLGREILEKEGLTRHAIVCETHVGVGLTEEDIETNNFPLPKRDMTPKSLEEKIICFADKFYSKNENSMEQEKSIPEIRKMIEKFGQDKLRQFDEWLIFFKEV